MYHTVLCLVVVCCCCCSCLDNGVALTPPMGWMSWERFECNTNCDTDPRNCISEVLLKETADVMVRDGWRDAGYQYVSIDDCWLARARDSTGRLQADPDRFPNGMKHLADYMHTRGLKLGLYEDVGTKTCAGFPGSQGNYDLDAQTMADWGVDMLKFDGCNAEVAQFNIGWPAMGRALNKTGRPIVYSCEWAQYMRFKGAKPDQPLIAKTCNMMRQLTDIYDSWDSIIGMIEFFADDPDNFSSQARPGAWNDPDQVVIGNFGLSPDQERVQMALWAVMASPILVSADFRSMRASSRDILLNKGVIDINQDVRGIQGNRVAIVEGIHIWTRPVTPGGSFAVAFLNTQESGYPQKLHITLADIHIKENVYYDVIEVFENTFLGYYKPDTPLSISVNPTGVYLIRVSPSRKHKLKLIMDFANSVLYPDRL